MLTLELDTAQKVNVVKKALGYWISNAKKKSDLVFLLEEFASTPAQLADLEAAKFLGPRIAAAEEVLHDIEAGGKEWVREQCSPARQTD